MKQILCSELDILNEPIVFLINRLLKYNVVLTFKGEIFSIDRGTDFAFN